MPYDVAVVIPTTIPRSLEAAVHSVFNQDFDGTIQVMVGLDYPCGNKEDLWILQLLAPRNCQVDVVHMGYSTRTANGGLYEHGVLGTILTFSANARYVTYLPDDSWMSPDRISNLMTLIKADNCEWVRHDGHILIDKIKCHEYIPTKFEID